MIRIANHSPNPFAGWKRVMVDKTPPHPSGKVGDVVYVTGLQSAGLLAVDLLVKLAPGQKLELDLSTGTQFDYSPPPLPADIGAHFGGLLTIEADGPLPKAMHCDGIEVDGASFVGRFRCRPSPMGMPAVHGWVQWYPTHPALAYGEFVTVASNPAVTDLAYVATRDVVVRFGDAIVSVAGSGPGGVLLRHGDQLADGQGRPTPVTFIWPRHLTSATEWASAGAMADLGVCGVGLSQLWPDGNPLMPEGFSGRAWAAQHWPNVLRELHTRGPTALGPKPRSNDAGEFESQTYHPGGEAMVADGVGAEVVRWLSAIRSHAARPCNHLEADGTPLDLAKHPQLVGWDGRAHWHVGVSPDRLGKTANLTEGQAGGHWGPDVQHDYIIDLAASARLRWSPGAQWLLERQATVYLMQRTDRPGWSTTAFESAREWACEAEKVLALHRTLRNRELAELVVDRFLSRVDRVFLPAMAGKDLLKVFDRDPRVNVAGQGVQWWQESFAAAAVWRACWEVGGREEAMDACVRIARRVLDVAWKQVDGRWQSQPQGPIDGSANDANPASYSFNSYAMPGCVWLVLQVEPTHAKARSIWAQLLAEPGEKARRWMLPMEVR